MTKKLKRTYLITFCSTAFLVLPFSPPAQAQLSSSQIVQCNSPSGLCAPRQFWNPYSRRLEVQWVPYYPSNSSSRSPSNSSSRSVDDYVREQNRRANQIERNSEIWLEGLEETNCLASSSGC